ncbi:hypothetical protein D3C72_1799240 [compost metagenome]
MQDRFVFGVAGGKTVRRLPVAATLKGAIEQCGMQRHEGRLPIEEVETAQPRRWFVIAKIGLTRCHKAGKGERSFALVQKCASRRMQHWR